MSVITEVMKRTGANRADIVRVATHGGDTRADWAIAYAIEKAGGRRASELMLTAGRDQMIAEIWGDSGAAPEPVAPTNPRAEYDPEITVYSEDTAPDGPNRIAPNHPHDDVQDDIEDQEDDDLQAAETLAATVHADLAELLDDTEAAHRLTAAWSTPTEGRAILRRVLSWTPRTAAEIQAREITAALAA